MKKPDPSNTFQRQTALIQRLRRLTLPQFLTNLLIYILLIKVRWLVNPPFCMIYRLWKMNLLLLITTPHVFNISHHKTTLLAHFSTESQETTPPIIQSTTVTHGITRTTLSSASSSFLHDYNVSMTSNDSTSILTNPVFNMTDLTTTAVEPGIVTNSLNVTDSLGTKHDQLIYIIIATSILFICTFLSVYVVIKKKRNYQRMHVLHHPSNSHIDYLNDEPEDSVIEFELRTLKN